mmetsp:Transcript_13181/g.25157  ORF Transcript_13181/g.25157 Transcript_13181/m.25157 type:complete len:309 (+) Transcript_13181:988-1914(+)
MYNQSSVSMSSDTSPSRCSSVVTSATSWSLFILSRVSIMYASSVFLASADSFFTWSFFSNSFILILEFAMSSAVRAGMDASTCSTTSGMRAVRFLGGFSFLSFLGSSAVVSLDSLSSFCASAPVSVFAGSSSAFDSAGFASPSPSPGSASVVLDSVALADPVALTAAVSFFLGAGGSGSSTTASALSSSMTPEELAEKCTFTFPVAAYFSITPSMPVIRYDAISGLLTPSGRCSGSSYETVSLVSVLMLGRATTRFTGILFMRGSSFIFLFVATMSSPPSSSSSFSEDAASAAAAASAASPCCCTVMP